MFDWFVRLRSIWNQVQPRWSDLLWQLVPAIWVLLGVLALAAVRKVVGPDSSLGLALEFLNVDMATATLLLALMAGLILAGFWVLRKMLWEHTKTHRPPLILLGLWVALTASTVWFAETRIEPKHRVQSDESIFLAVAQNMNHRFVAGTCEEAFMDKGMECVAGADQKFSTDHFKLKAQSFIYAVLMPILGKDLKWIFGFQLVLFATMLLGCAYVIWLWTRSHFLSLAVTAFLGWAPIVLFQYRSVSVEPLYLVLCALVIWMLHVIVHAKTIPAFAWIWFGAGLAFFAQTRQETLFALPAFALFALPAVLRSTGFHLPQNALFKNAKVLSLTKLWNQPLALFLTSLSFLLIPSYLLIFGYWGYGFQGGEYSAHGHFVNNVKMLWQQMTLPHTREFYPDAFARSWEALKEYWLNAKDPELLTAPFLASLAWLALAGLPVAVWRMFREEQFARIGAFLILFHFQSYMILENVSGDLGIEINMRYALIWMPVIAFLAALFLEFVLLRLLPWAFPESLKVKDSMLLGALVAVLAICITWRHENSFEQNAMYKDNHLTTEESLIHTWLKSQPEGPKLFVYNRPFHFVGYGMSAIHYATWDEMSAVDKQALLDRFQGQVFYVRGLDCAENQNNHAKAVGQDRSSVCGMFEARHGLETVHEELVLNSYPLKIAKIRLDLQPGGVAVNLSPRILGFRVDGNLAVVGVNWPQCQPTTVVQPIWNGEVGNSGPCQPQPFGIQLGSFKPGVNTIEVKIAQDNQEHILKGRLIAPGPGLVNLASIAPHRSMQVWMAPKVDSSVNGNPLTVAGTYFANGIGTHANSRIDYVLPEEFKSFKVYIGLDDEEIGGDGAVFRIYGNGKILAESKVLVHGQVDSLEVDLTGIQELGLETDQGPTDNYDHTNWLLPLLTRKN